MSANPVVQVLTEARARVERGWCQGVYEDRDGNVCILGALSEAGRATQAACRFLKWACCYNYLDEWNDVPGRTQAEVVAAFSRAIAVAEAEL